MTKRKKEFVVKSMIVFMSLIICFITGCHKNDVENSTASMQSMYFLGVEGGRTTIYYYNVQEEETSVVGYVDGALSNAVLDEENGEIMATYTFHDPTEFYYTRGIVKFNIQTGSTEELFNMGKINNSNEQIDYNDNVKMGVFPDGEKCAILNITKTGRSMILFDFDTKESQIIMQGIDVRWFQCRENGKILYADENGLKSYDIVTETHENLIENFNYGGEADPFEVSNDLENLVTRRNKKKPNDKGNLYVYNLKKDKYSKIGVNQWQISYGGNYFWDATDEYIYYTESIRGLFESGKERLMVYNTKTEEKTLLFMIDEWTNVKFDFVR